MNYTAAEATALINKNLGTNFATFEDVQAGLKALPTPNEDLKDLLNKISKMIIVDSFQSELLEKWSNAFTSVSERIEIGALAEIVDTALLAAKEDVIASNTDLLPDLTAIPAQYVKRMSRNFSKRVEVITNASVYERAFTSIQAFNSFINLVVKRGRDTMVKAFYDFVFGEVMKGIKNIQTITPTIAEGDNYAITMNKLYGLIAANTPYTDKFNVMSADGVKILAADIDNASGTDIPVKINTLELTKENGEFKFPALILLTGGGILQGIQSELSEVFHNTVLDPYRKFKDVIVIPNDIYQQLRIAYGIEVPTNEFLFFVLDERTLVVLTFLEAIKSQSWIKAPGGGLIQTVLSQWNSVGFIPWGNGAAFKFKYKPATAPTPTPAKV